MVADNYTTHNTSDVRQWLLRHPHWQLHFIPTHSSWLDQVERFFAKITLEVIRRGLFTSVPHLRKSTLYYIGAHNKTPKPFVWTANAELELEEIENYFGEIA